MLLILLVSRGLMIASSTGELHVYFPNIEQQFFLSERLAAQSPPTTLVHEMIDNAEYYLPRGRQFHGLLYLNNVLVYAAGRVLGSHYCNAQVVALGYHALAFVCWALLALRVAGRRAMLIFAAMFIVAPRGMIEAGLFLQGSHAEAQGLIALAFLLAFGSRGSPVGRGRSWWLRVDGVDALFLLLAPLLWLYKGVLLFLPFALVALALKMREDPLRKRLFALRALVLLGLGSLPAMWFFSRYGFYAHYVADSAAYHGGPSLLTVFRAPQLDAAAFRFPPWNLDPPWDVRGPRVIVTLWAVSLVGALAAARRAFREDDRRASWAVAAVAAFPALFGVPMYLSSIPILERYYYPLYPLVPVVVAVGLARWRAPLSAAAVALWVVMSFSAQTDFIHPDRLDMGRRYDGLSYAKAGVFHAPPEDVEWLNAWLADCPTLASPGLVFWNSLTGALATDISTRGMNEHALDAFPERLRYVADVNPPWEDEWRALGAALGLKLRGDETAFGRILSDARLTPPVRDWLVRGFADARERGVGGLCPAEPPAAPRAEFKAYSLERRRTRLASP